MRLPCLLVAAAMLLCGCGQSVKKADLTVINGAEPETLDPAIITGQPEERVVNALFEGLTSFDQHGLPVPGVAQSWEISPDGRTYTFHLRDNAKWSDGTPVTANDFVDSWQRTLTPETASAYNYQLYYIKNAEDFANGKLKNFTQVGVKAPDARTLVVELTNPTSFFLDLCATPTLYPMPIKLIDQVGDDWIKPEHIINNGAYLLSVWRINDKIRLEKNPLYWNQAHIALQTVDVLPIAKDTVAYNFYATGQADLVMDKGLMPPALMDDLKKLPDFHAAPFLGSYFLRFNCAHGPFKDERVRRAFAMTVDKERIVKKITRAGESAADGFVPPGIEGYDSAHGLPYNPAAARKLLADAGYPDGKGFPLVSYLYSEGTMNEAIAIELQSMWQQQLGVQINLARQEWKVYLNSLGSLDYDIARSSWVGDYPDPNTFLDMFVTDGGNNRTGFASKTYDTLIAQAAAETDPEKRFDILRQAEGYLLTDAAAICPIFYYVGIQLYNPDKLGGISANVLDEHPISAMYRK